MPICAARLTSASLALPAGSPGRDTPETSPLASWMKTGTPAADEALGEDLQRDGLAGAGGAGDQPVTICVMQQQVSRLGVVLAAAAHQDSVVGHRLPLEIFV